MLTAKDLALIRASLLFFEEENSQSQSIMQPYFGKDSCRGITTETICNLRNSLQKCRLSYILVDQRHLTLVTPQIYSSIARAQKAVSHRSIKVESVLLFAK